MPEQPMFLNFLDLRSVLFEVAHHVLGRRLLFLNEVLRFEL